MEQLTQQTALRIPAGVHRSSSTTKVEAIDELRPTRRRRSWNNFRDSLQQPLMAAADTLKRRSKRRASRKSLITGPQTHRLPPKVMWGITMLTAVSMAFINWITILLIEYSVKWKFAAMQWIISDSGLWLGILCLVLASDVYAFIGVALIQFVAPSCGGSGLPENKCYLNGANMPGFYTKRTLRVRIATTILANAAGYPVGREGPTVVIGSNVAYLLSRKFCTPYVKETVDWSEQGRSRPALVVDEERFAHATRIVCAVGGACGMAMIFNAPFGGLLYMFEEMTSSSWAWELTFLVFAATMGCTILSYAMLNIMGKTIEEFVIFTHLPSEKNWEWRDVPWFIVLAATLGVLTSLHTRGMLAMAALRGRLAKKWTWYGKPWVRIAETLAYCSICVLSSTGMSLMVNCVKQGVSEMQYVQFNCEEGYYNPMASLLVNTSHSACKLLFSGNNGGEIHWRASILAFITYYLLNVGLTGLPVPGGAFTATMLLGGLFGRCVGGLGRDLGLVRSVSGVYAVVGSAAMLCGFKQMSLAVVLIVVECVNDLTLAPMVMLSVFVSMSVNWQINPRGHDEAQIYNKKLPFLEGDAPVHLDGTVATDICDAVPESAFLLPETPVIHVRTALDESKELQYFPIVERGPGVGIGQHVVGIITRAHLEAAMRASAGKTLQIRSRSRAFNDNPFKLIDDEQVINRIGATIPLGTDKLPLHRIMDPTPFTIVEDMPAARLYSIFAKAGEHAVVVTARTGEFRGIISREGLIKASRE